jgi:hypothetical protein
MDPDPAIFFIDLQDPTKQIFLLIMYFFKELEHSHHFSKIKNPNEVTNISFFSELP